MRRDQDFPISMEAQLLGGRGDGSARSTANVCTPGTNLVMNGQLDTRHCIESSSRTFDGDQWVRAEFEVHGGGEVIHRVNGETVLREVAKVSTERPLTRPIPAPPGEKIDRLAHLEGIADVMPEGLTHVRQERDRREP